MHLISTDTHKTEHFCFSIGYTTKLSKYLFTSEFSFRETEQRKLFKQIEPMHYIDFFFGKLLYIAKRIAFTLWTKKLYIVGFGRTKLTDRMKETEWYSIG